MKFSELTTASARLRAQVHRQDLQKEAMVGALLKGGLNIGRKLVGGTAKAVTRTATAPVRMPVKGLARYAVKNPLQAGFGALALADAGSSGKKVYKAQRAAQMSGQFGSQMNKAVRHAERIDPTHQGGMLGRF